VPAVGERLWLPTVLEDLASRGITRLMVEGGPSLWQAFSRAGFVDAAEAFVATRDLELATAAIAQHLDLAQLVRSDVLDIGPLDLQVSLRLRTRSHAVG
jgi:riboflavin biosynthesis pyrimidine reductase